MGTNVDALQLIDLADLSFLLQRHITLYWHVHVILLVLFPFVDIIFKIPFDGDSRREMYREIWRWCKIEVFALYVRCMDDIKYLYYHLLLDRVVPEHVHNADCALNGDTTSCSICTNDMGHASVGEVVIKCGHRFHGMCLQNWEQTTLEMAKGKWQQNGKSIRFSDFKANYRCPLCRTTYQRWKEKWHCNPIGHHKLIEVSMNWPQGMQCHECPSK